MMSGYYVNNQAKTWPTKIDETKHKPIGSVLNDFYKAASRDYGPPDDGIRRVGGSVDADTSQCGDWKNITPDQKIITKFAGYLLEYPCTIKTQGDFTVGYNPDGSINFQHFFLSFNVNLGQKNYDGIWWQGGSDDRGKAGFQVSLYSDGADTKHLPFKEWIKKAEKIKEIKDQNLVIYFDKKSHNVRGYLMDQFDQHFNPPFVFCVIPPEINPEELFLPIQSIEKSLICNALWFINDDIKVRILGIDTDEVYHFNEIYQTINRGLKKAIIKTPQQQS